VILNDLIREFPVVKFSSHDERFKLLDKKLFDFLLLEHPKEVFEKEITVTELNAEFDGDSDQCLKLLSFLFFELIKFSESGSNLNLGVFALTVHQRFCLIKSVGNDSVSLNLGLLNDLLDDFFDKKLQFPLEDILAEERVV
jgi:hypothetical protein